MNQRQRDILNAVISEYQKTGQPVASQVLVKNFHLSPATIRAEMLALDKEGFLKQPYHSAGRIPTTKAYRQFVDQLLEEQMPQQIPYLKDEQKIKKDLQRFDLDKTISYQLAQTLADFSRNLGMSGFLGQEPDFHEAGLASLVEEFKIYHPENIIDILKGFDQLEKNFVKFFDELNKKIEIFIGEENPINELNQCSLVVSGYQRKRLKGFLGILGPKRMNYRRNILLIEKVKKIIENF